MTQASLKAPTAQTEETPQSSAIMNTYGRFPIAFERGEGMYLYNTEGEGYLDFFSGIAVNALGHAHPHAVKAVQDQAAKLWHVTNLFQIPAQERFAQRLVETSFADVVFFCNSGLEAMEAALKAARRYHYKAGAPQRWRTITVQGAFHGRSLATIAAAGNPKYMEGFGKPVDGFDSVPFGDLDAVKAAITDETAAIALEPVLGEGGIQPAQLSYLQALRSIADEAGILLIFDEIQCGMGRTGKLWAHEWAGIAPDLLASAKGLGGGFPIGAVLASHKGASGMEPGVHGTTFGGNLLAMAAGNAVLDVMLAPGFLDQVDQTARYFWHELLELVAKYNTVFETVRGAGFMLGIKLKPSIVNGEFVKALLDNKLITVVAADNIVRVMPPLIASKADCDAAIQILEKTAIAFTKNEN